MAHVEADPTIGLTSVLTGQGGGVSRWFDATLTANARQLEIDGVQVRLARPLRPGALVAGHDAAVASPSTSCSGCCSAAIVTGVMQRRSSAAAKCVTAGTCPVAPTASRSASPVRSSSSPCSPTHRASTCCASRRRRRRTTSRGSPSRTSTSRCDRRVASRCWRTATARRQADRASRSSSSTWRGRSRRCPIRTRGTCSTPISGRRPSARCGWCSTWEPDQPAAIAAHLDEPIAFPRTADRAAAQRRRGADAGAVHQLPGGRARVASAARSVDRGNICSGWRLNDRAGQTPTIVDNRLTMALRQMRLLMQPQVQWEPVIDPLGVLRSTLNGGPTLVGAQSVKLVPVSPDAIATGDSRDDQGEAPRGGALLAAVRPPRDGAPQPAGRRTRPAAASRGRDHAARAVVRLAASRRGRSVCRPPARPTRRDRCRARWCSSRT